jgi:hypothetical protein
MKDFGSKLIGVENKMSIDSFQVVTYPRSGLNFLISLLGQQGYSISAFHAFTGIDKRKSILTIARNPIDSISSYFGRVTTWKKHFDYPGIEKMLQTYIETYTWLIENYNYAIDYEDLVSNPNSTIEKLLAYFDMPHKDIEYNLDLVNQDPAKKYLLSSKNTEWYQASREYLVSAKLIDEANDIYRQMLFANWAQG